MRPEVFTLARSQRATPGGEGRPRHEIKFALAAADQGKLRSILRANFREVRHASTRSIVRSLYFDDEFLGAYHDSVEGTGTRLKLRLRWYNDSDRSLFFEIKKREFDLISKRRIPIDASAGLASASHQVLLRQLLDVLEPEPRELLRRRSRPVLIAEYARDYYEGSDGVRVTVDSELQWFEQLGARWPRRRFGVGLPHSVVLEAKLPVGRKLDVATLLRPLRLTPTRSSKYVIGCDRLGVFGEQRAI